MRTFNSWKPLVWVVLILAVAVPSASAGTSYRSTVLAEINAARAANGLPALKPSRSLGLSAQRYSKQMAATGMLSHELGPPLGERVGKRGAWVGETLALGMSAPGTVQAWLGSAGHAAQMLSPRYRFVGVGAATGSYNGRPAVFVTAQYVS
jgi:uncharacterized protein YkwD